MDGQFSESFADSDEAPRRSKMVCLAKGVLLAVTFEQVAAHRAESPRQIQGADPGHDPPGTDEDLDFRQTPRMLTNLEATALTPEFHHPPRAFQSYRFGQEQASARARA